jgi:hypothetical protein
MIRNTKTAGVLAILLVAILLRDKAHAVDFVFHYDDPAGFGFFDPTIRIGDIISLGERRRAAMEAAGAIWGRLIRPSYFGEEIVVHAKFDDLGAGKLASADPNFYYSDFGSSNPQYQGETNYPKALANHLAGRDLAPQRHEIDITINETVTTFFYLDALRAGLTTDFVTTAAHELGHGLGFDTSFQEDGDYGLHGDGEHVDPGCIGCLPTPYDRFLTRGQMGPTLLSLSDDDARKSALTSNNNLFWNGTNGIAGNGGTAPPIHAPTSFVAGTSASHLNRSLDAASPIIMAPSYLGVRQTPSAVERGIMRDLGWNVWVTPSAVNWTGAGADNNASTPANWGSGIPLPGDSLAFGASPRTDVNLNVTLYSIANVTFAAGAPAYTLTFARQNSTDITGSITNNSGQTQKIVVSNGIGTSGRDF